MRSTKQTEPAVTPETGRVTLAWVDVTEPTVAGSVVVAPPPGAVQRRFTVTPLVSKFVPKIVPGAFALLVAETGCTELITGGSPNVTVTAFAAKPTSPEGLITIRLYWPGVRLPGMTAES